MTSKIVFLCVSAILIEAISAGCCGGRSGAGIGLGAGSNIGLASASNGGGFPVQSASPISVNGLSVLSENQIKGCLDLGGQLPFIGAVGLGGQLPTCGSAGVNYCCGNGKIGINQSGRNLGSYGLHH